MVSPPLTVELREKDGEKGLTIDFDPIKGNI